MDSAHGPRSALWMNYTCVTLHLRQSHPRTAQPGWKVFHANDFDFMSTCRTFTLCLQELKAWHDQNPRHLPITVSMNIKDNELDNKFRDALSPAMVDILSM